jgi:fumarate hydratase class I
MTDFNYTPMFPLGDDSTVYRLISTEGINTVQVGEREFLEVSAAAIELLSYEAIKDSQHLLRSSHLAQLRKIIDDPESSPNDRFVALDLLKNANISAGGVLPMCQDTGTAIVKAERGMHILTAGTDEAAISKGMYQAYQNLNLRYSQLAPISMFNEKNTGTNMPAQIEIGANTDPTEAGEYQFLFIAKGGGSANKSMMYQETTALLNPVKLMNFLDEKLRLIGTSACPPYHLAIVIGGTSAEYTLKTAKLASARYLDSLPTEGNELGHAFRDLELEQEVLKLTQGFGIGAQFGGKYFCHDVRVIRLPRHGASCPVAIAVSCSADRQIMGKITKDGIFLEQLETDPAKYLPEVTTTDNSDVIEVNLSRPMQEIRYQLSQHPVKTRLSLTGTLIVARDLAHARIAEMLDRGEELPEYFKTHAVYYAGPAKTPAGMPSGSFGPTTAGRMDTYVERFQAAGGSLVMLAKGNRSAEVTSSCKTHGGFYLGSIGGPAARLAHDNITNVEVLDFPELGMEAIWKIEVKNFPAFIVIDDKGNDFYADTLRPIALTVPAKK